MMYRASAFGCLKLGRLSALYIWPIKIKCLPSHMRVWEAKKQTSYVSVSASVPHQKKKRDKGKVRIQK